MDSQTAKITPEMALKQAKAATGGNTGLAEGLSRTKKITPQAVSQWKQVPPDRVLAVESLTGVSRHLLRPDIYGEVL